MRSIIFVALIVVIGSATLTAAAPEAPAARNTVANATTIDEIINAADFDPSTDPEVLRLYRAFFNRDPDVDGAKYWIGVRDDHESREIALTFTVASAEFANLYRDAADDEVFLDRVYENVLGRRADDIGFRYWLDVLRGTNTSRENPAYARIDRGSVVFYMALNDEFVAAHPFLPAAAAESITFAAIGDFGTDDERQRLVSELVASWDPDFIITAGDNRYGARSMDAVIGGHYCNWLDDVQGGDRCPGGASSINRFFPSAGNHDYKDGGGISEYTDYFTLPGADVESTNTSGTELYYDFIQGPVHLFAIDSHGASKTKQQEWLEKTAAASTSLWQIVFFHHPAYSSSSVHGSQPNMQWDFAAWGVDAVIAGHDHTYERIERDGILYFVNGLGGRTIYGLGEPVEGSQVRYNGDNGAMRITADSTEMTFQFVDTSGTVIDSRTIR